MIFAIYILAGIAFYGYIYARAPRMEELGNTHPSRAEIIELFPEKSDLKAA